MPRHRLRRPSATLRVVTLALGAVLLAPWPGHAQDATGRDAAVPETAPAIVYLVRHAEKEAEPAADPPLTEEGQARARALAHVLSDAGLTRIWSSDYVRTRDTAAPVAEAAGLEVQLYDPSNLPFFATALREEIRTAEQEERGGQRILVVGHSNTTPALAALLGGEPGEPIYEPTEYDRLYVLVIGPDGATTTTLLRFGEPSPQR